MHFIAAVLEQVSFFSFSVAFLLASPGEQRAERGAAAERRHGQRVPRPEPRRRRRRKQESTRSRQAGPGEEKEHLQETHSNAR